MRKSTGNNWGVMLKSYSLIFAIFLLSCAGQKDDSNKETVKIKLTDLQFTDLKGNTFNGEKYLGTPVLVHFWATWCAPCIREMPHLANAMNKIDGLTFIFPSDEDIHKIQDFAVKRGFPFEFLQLTTSTAFVGVSVLPTSYLFNSKGELVEIIRGTQSWNSPEMINRLNKHAGEI